mmetsp:Transcript_44447/g.142875  ORF Transcript_44447/g.142875 Transcript_44447/m.142875 type:complete len:99 (+) Transcript_44447:392-688(+)
MQLTVKELIDAAAADGEIHSRDWEREPMPSRDTPRDRKRGQLGGGSYERDGRERSYERERSGRRRSRSRERNDRRSSYDRDRDYDRRRGRDYYSDRRR